MNNRITSPLTT